MQYICRLGTPDGRVVEEIHQAANEASVRSGLEGRGYHVFAVRPRGLPFKLSLPSLARRKKRVSEEQFLVFNQELAGLLRAGLPLLQALDLMLERRKDPHFRAILTEVRDRVKNGEDLSEAFSRFGDLFPALYASSLKAGERSGELEQVIRRFIRYLRLVMDARKRVVSALVYPAVLVGLSIVMIGVMTVVVIPKFKGFYDAMDLDLPGMTRGILEVSLFVRAHRWWLLGGLVLAFFVFRRWGTVGLGRQWVDRWKLRVPLLGSILHRFSLSEFCRSLGTLLSGGLPLVPALEVAVGSVGNLHIRSRLDPLVGWVKEGKAFYASLEETEVFTDLAIDMVKVGETTGALDEMLSSVSDFFDEEIETSMQRVLSLVEPMMLIFMGLAVGLLLISMYLPLFSILGQLQ